MSGPPRRKSVPPAPPPSFDDERPTPIASEAAPTTTTTTTQTEMELAPEPPTILAISITAPTFKSSDQVPAARMPSFADAAVTGPFAKTHIREGEGRTLLDMPKVSPPSGKITAPSFEEASRSGPFPRSRTREGDSDTLSERIQLPPDEEATAPPISRPPPPTPAAPRPAPKVPPPDRADRALDRKPTEMADPWEYKGEVPAQAASLANDYESGGVELDNAGRLVAHGLKPRGRGKREKSEVSEVSSAVDLFSVAMDVWPDEPPPAPAAPPRVEPVAGVPPEPPPEPDTAPRPPPPPPPNRAASNRSGPKSPAVLHQETVLRSPRSVTEPELEEGSDPEAGFFEEPDESGVVTDERSAGDPYPTPAATPAPSKPRRLTSDEERYGHQEQRAYEDRDPGDESQGDTSGLEAPTNIRGAYSDRRYGQRTDDDDRYGDDQDADDQYADDRQDDGDGGYDPQDDAGYDDRLDDSTGRRRPVVRRRSRWPRRLFLLVLLGGGGGALWLWYTGQWSSLLSTFGLR